MSRGRTPSNSPLARPLAVNGDSVGSGTSNASLGPERVPSGEFVAMSQSRDQAASQIAATQRTMVTVAQLAECGIGKDAIAHRVNSGRLSLELHGVYSFGCGELPPLAREQAALLVCGERAFLSHRSAAFVWGLRETAPAPVEVSVVRRGCRTRDGVHVHRISSIDRRELRHTDGLWVSSPARAVLEVAAVAPAELADVIDEGIAHRRLNRRDLEAVLARNRPCRGAARLAALLGEAGAVGITRSQAERAFWKLIRASGLPRPEPNVPLGRFVPDFTWRRERLIVEIDSYGFHAGPNAFQNDREKDLVYRDAGYDVLRFTRYHVVHQPATVLVRLAQALARRPAYAD
jgi:very-short-patch-repair endonuclease